MPCSIDLYTYQNQIEVAKMNNLPMNRNMKLVRQAMIRKMPDRIQV